MYTLKVEIKYHYRALETIQFFLFTFTPRALVRLRSIKGTLHYSKGIFLNMCISVFQHFCESLGLSLYVSKCDW